MTLMSLVCPVLAECLGCWDAGTRCQDDVPGVMGVMGVMGVIAKMTQHLTPAETHGDMPG